VVLLLAFDSRLFDDACGGKNRRKGKVPHRNEFVEEGQDPDASAAIEDAQAHADDSSAESEMTTTAPRAREVGLCSARVWRTGSIRAQSGARGPEDPAERARRQVLAGRGLAMSEGGGGGAGPPDEVANEEDDDDGAEGEGGRALLG
jgi:hypothetical protein